MDIRRVFASWRHGSRQLPFAVQFKKFQNILERNNRVLELMADMGDKLGGEYVFDRHYLEQITERIGAQVFQLISDLSMLSQRKNVELFKAFEHIRHQLEQELSGHPPVSGYEYVLPLESIGAEQAEQAGSKVAHLGEARARLSLTVPDGFVITTRAFFDFMNQDGLLQRAADAMEVWDGSDATLRELSEDMRQRILTAPLPRGLAKKIQAETDRLLKGRPAGAVLAVRSSAWHEDGESSFAGQYASVLGIGRDDVLDAYREVVASAYSATAWRYRVLRGFREHEVAMAVGVQIMLDGEVSGVLHTYAPHVAEGVMALGMVRGQCAAVVDGSAPTTTLTLDRVPPHAVVSVSPEDALLSPAQLRELAEAAMALERYAKRPQDIEWTFDRQGRLVILQTRPLRFWAAPDTTEPGVAEATRDAEIIFSGRGHIAQRGLASGPARVVRTDRDLDTFPDGAILVARHTSPRYSRVMRKARGIITDIGSPTGHMATIAREFRIPALVGAEVATRLLRDGDEITLDCSQGVVYRGRIRALDRFELTEAEVFEDTYEYRLLRRLLAHIAPLNLIDPSSESFAPHACRTYHDITRYIHENAIRELIALSERHGDQRHSTPKRLITTIPLGLVVIDGGEGATCLPDAREVRVEDIACPLFKDFIIGIDCGMWRTDPVPVNLGSFMSSLTRTFSSALAAPDQIGRNLAVVLPNYMNLNMRLGYHFNIINAYVCDEINDNYIYFRFMGGVTEFIRRSRRAKFLAEILERFDFRVEIHGDLVVGRVKKLDATRMARRMRMLGALVGYARQLDARMHSEDDVRRHVQTFLHATHELCGGEHDHGIEHLAAPTAHPGSR